MPGSESTFQFQPIGGGSAIESGRRSPCSLDSFIEASKWTSFFNSPVHSDDDDDSNDDDDSDDSDDDSDDCRGRYGRRRYDDDEEEEEEDQPSGDSGVGSSYSGDFHANYFDRDNICSYMIGKQILEGFFPVFFFFVFIFEYE